MIRATYIASLSLVVVLISAIILAFVQGNLKHPDSLISGRWKEVSWQYNKLDNSDDPHVSETKIPMSDELKTSISEGLHIHQSEIWTFNENSSLILEKPNEKATKLNWKLKGRGHILKIHRSNQQNEFYQIRKLSKDKMVLHFENDLHARGIVQIVLKKIK